MIVFLKSIRLHLLSFRCHSSKSCSIIFNTSGDAFSISSNRTTLYGLRLTCSVSIPHCSYHTYHGADQISFETLCFSISSDISTLIIAFSSQKYSFARSFARYVFPTHDGPKNRNDAIGLEISTGDNLLLLIAFTTASTASS